MKYRRYISYPVLFVAVLLLRPGVVVPQPAMLHTNFLDQLSGLPDLSNAWVYADSKGWVWISSNNGLVLFDGNKTRVFRHIEGDSLSLPDNIVQSNFYEDEDGNLWFCTYTALVCYIRKYNHFQRIPLPAELGQNGFHIAFEDPNLGLALTVDRKKLYFFDRKNRIVDIRNGIPMHGETRLYPVYDDQKELTAIVGTFHNKPGLQLYRFSGRRLVSAKQIFSGIQPGEPTLSPLSIAGDQYDSLWIAAEEGLFSFNPATEKLQKLSAGDAGFLDVAVWNEQFLLASCPKGDLSAFDRKSGKWIQTIFLTNSKIGVNDHPVNKITIDRYGTVWLSMFSQGIAFGRPDRIKFNQLIVQQEERPDNTFVPQIVAKDERDNIWCLAQTNALYFSAAPQPPDIRRTFQRRPFTGLKTRIFYLLLGAGDDIWALCFDGLYRSRRTTLQFKKMADGFFLHGIHLADGRLLFAADEQGLLVWDGHALSAVALQGAPEVALSFIMLFQDQQGRVYASEGLQDIWVISPEENFNVFKIIPFSAEVHSFHPAMFQQPGAWIGSSAGLAFLDAEKWTIGDVKVQEEVTQPNVYSILQDATRRLWLGTDRGLIAFDLKNNKTTRYGPFDGLLPPGSFKHTLLALSSSQFWLGGQYGLNYFNPYALTRDNYKPKVYLSNILVNDNPQKPLCQETGSTNVIEIKAIRLSKNERTLSFDVAVLDYGNPEQTGFRYRMLPEEKEWVSAQTGERIRYPNLAAGKHTLEVVGINSEGVASEPTYLKITVEKKMLEHWLFYVVAALVVGMAGYWVSRYRTRQMLREANLRNRIAADLHDDIGAALSNVRILNTLVRQRTDPDSEAATFLDRIDEEVGHSAESLDDIIWSVNPQNDPLDRVLARIRRFASEVFEAKDIAGDINLPPNTEGLKLSMERRRVFYLFAKEAINNLAKYARCNRASLQVGYENGLLTFTVSDNGVGFDVESARNSGNGLKTMAERARALKGKMSLQSVPGQGTVVQLVFPLTENGD